MNMQAVWVTSIENFQAFKEAARSRPDEIYLTGECPSVRQASTFSTLLEERGTFWVRGSVWRARIVRKSRGELAEDYRERNAARSVRQRRKVRQAAIPKFMIFQEA